MRRILFAAASLLLAGCQSATEPQRSVTPAAATHDEFTPPDAVPDGSCRSGWSVPGGRCV
jgi:uncharacterized lipoprotein YajG